MNWVCHDVFKLATYRSTQCITYTSGSQPSSHCDPSIQFFMLWWPLNHKLFHKCNCTTVINCKYLICDLRDRVVQGKRGQAPQVENCWPLLPFISGISPNFLKLIKYFSECPTSTAFPEKHFARFRNPEFSVLWSQRRSGQGLDR